MEDATEQVDVDPGTTSDTGTTAETLTSDAGNQTTDSGPELETAQESFYDPSTLPPELQGSYKEMQGAFTRKMQEQSEYMKSAQAKIEAFDAFQANPQGMLQQLMAQYGVQQPQQVDNDEWNPENWQEVTERIKQETRESVLQELQPMLGKVRDLQKSQIETTLDTKHPDWRVYEKDMIDLMQQHPTLANDPDRLYDMAVPAEVKARRATQAALKKLEGSSQGASVSGPSSTSKKPSGLPPVTDFTSAVAHAKEKLRTGQ